MVAGMLRDRVLTRGFDVHETLSLVESERLTTLHGVPWFTEFEVATAAIRGFVQRDLGSHDLLAWVLMPDHVPHISGPNERGVAFAFAYGYIRALIQATEGDHGAH
jgi:hypothetical protein